MRTTAVLVEEPGGPFVLSDVELDEPRADEVLVRIVATGLCHTDLTVPTMMPAEMFPLVLGHEGAGVVEAVGPDVTGIEVMATATVDYILRMARAIRLLGADCVISGIRPNIAMTIVQMGVDLTGISTKRTLRDALAPYVVAEAAKPASGGALRG